MFREIDGRRFILIVFQMRFEVRTPTLPRGSGEPVVFDNCRLSLVHFSDLPLLDICTLDRTMSCNDINLGVVRLSRHASECEGQ
jgi:hypothetical protein